MKSIKNLYAKVCDFESLYKAHLRARRGKRNKSDVILFENNLSCNLVELNKELLSKDYKIGQYRKFTVYEPKRRIIMSLPYRDRVVQHSLSENILEPLLERLLIFDNCASRKGKGTHFGLYRLSGFMRDFYNKRGTDGWVLKGDVKNYFYSIDHDILKEKLFRYINDVEVKWLFNHIIDSTKEGVGVPIGNLTSQYFAVFYLNTIDRFVKEELKIKYYSRYMDDFVLIHHDKEYLKECKKNIEKKCKDELKLELNPKTQIFPIRNGVDYLGFHTYLTETGAVIRKIRKESKDRMKRKLLMFKREYGKGNKNLDDIRKCLASWLGHAKHGHTYRLRKKLTHQMP